MLENMSATNSRRRLFAARNWVRRIRKGPGLGARLGPGLYFELRYEGGDLVQCTRNGAAGGVRFPGRDLRAGHAGPSSPWPVTASPPREAISDTVRSPTTQQRMVSGRRSCRREINAHSVRGWPAAQRAGVRAGRPGADAGGRSGHAWRPWRPNTPPCRQAAGAAGAGTVSTHLDWLAMTELAERPIFNRRTSRSGTTFAPLSAQQPPADPHPRGDRLSAVPAKDHEIEAELSLVAGAADRGAQSGGSTACGRAW